MLQERREAKGWSRAKLSEISGVPIRTIENIERGNIFNARGYTLKKLADAFGIWIDCLLTDEYDTEVTNESDD